MLEAEGLHAHAVLANSSWTLIPICPIHCNSIMPTRFWKLQGRRPGSIPHLTWDPLVTWRRSCAVKKRWLFQKRPMELRETPRDFPFTVEYRMGVDGTVDVNGTLDSTVELQTRGDLEVLIRLLNDHLSQEQLAKSADSVLARTNKFLYDSAQYSDFKVFNASDIARPEKTQFHVTGKLMYVNPRVRRRRNSPLPSPRPIAQWHLLSLLPAVDSKPDSNGKPQQLSTDLKGPKFYSLTLDLAFGVLVASDPAPPKDFRISEDSRNTQPAIRGKATPFMNPGRWTCASRIPAADSKEYAAFVEKIVDAKAVPSTPKKDNTAKVVGGFLPKADAATPSKSSVSATGPPKSAATRPCERGRG